MYEFHILLLRLIIVTIAWYPYNLTNVYVVSIRTSSILETLDFFLSPNTKFFIWVLNFPYCVDKCISYL